jgi:beta-lactamase regulating signal transducer with metallopeptidase domain
MAWWLFQNIVITTALAATVAMIGRTRRIGPVAKHALWVLVLLKFITPPLVVWPWAAPDPLGLAAPSAVVDESRAPIVTAMQANRADVIIGDESRSAGVTDVAITPAAAVAGISPWSWFIGIWIAGSLCLLGVEGARLARLARRIRSSRAAPLDPAIPNRVSVMSARLGIRALPVVVVRGTASPAVWGLGRPRLLWPANLPADLTDACIDGLIVHELAHVKRGDHLVGWIELAAGIVWWWNPLFWFVRSSLREQAELACDAWVISALPNGRRAYAESLLTLSAAAFSGVSSTPSMAVVGIRATNRRVLERRLVMIMQGRAPLRLPFVGLFCLAIVAMATLPAWATSQQMPPPPPPPSPVVVPSPPPPPPAVVTQTTQPRVVVHPTPPAPTRSVQRASVPVVTTTHAQQTPPTPPSVVTTPRLMRTVDAPRLHFAQATSLTEDGQKLVQGFDADREAIQKEVDQKIQARREAVIKELEKLQDQYAKAGKLDEAVAIRDYLRAGGPSATSNIAFRRIAR